MIRSSSRYSIVYLSCSILILNRPCSVTNTNRNLTIFVIPCMIDLQCCNYCHLLSYLLSKIWAFMTVLHYKNVRMQKSPNKKLGELKVILKSWIVCNHEGRCLSIATIHDQHRVVTMNLWHPQCLYFVFFSGVKFNWISISTTIILFHIIFLDSFTFSLNVGNIMDKYYVK